MVVIVVMARMVMVWLEDTRSHSLNCTLHTDGKRGKKEEIVVEMRER